MPNRLSDKDARRIARRAACRGCLCREPSMAGRDACDYGTGCQKVSAAVRAVHETTRFLAESDEKVQVFPAVVSDPGSKTPFAGGTRYRVVSGKDSARLDK